MFNKWWANYHILERLLNYLSSHVTLIQITSISRVSIRFLPVLRHQVICQADAVSQFLYSAAGLLVSHNDKGKIQIQYKFEQQRLFVM